MAKRELTRQQQIERSIITTYRSKLWAPFIKAIKDYELIKPNDVVCACISGGKDSMLLAKLLQELKTRRETHPNITAIREYSFPDECYLCSKCGCVCYGDYDYCISCGAKLEWE